jgi:HEAT repeat protein
LFFLCLAAWPAQPARAFAWPDAAERIESDLRATDTTTRRAAARGLASLGPTRGTALTLFALDDPDDEVQLEAARAAIRLHAAGATEKVVPWLNASDPRLRREACEVARALPSSRAVAPLGRTLGDPDAAVREAAAEALGHQSRPEAIPPLLGRLDDPTPTVRVAIVNALARLGDGRAAVPLAGKVEDSSPEVRQAVARALGELRDVRVSSALALALRDQNPDVRREAVIALGRLRAGDAVDAIAPFVSDRTPSLRVAALQALGAMATPGSLRVLVGALGEGDDASATLEHTAVRDALVQAGVAAVPGLHARLTGSTSPAVTASAAWVLGALGARTEAKDIVLAMRRGTLTTAAALRSLAGAGTASEVPVVLEFLNDPSPVVRAEALAAAGALLDPKQPDGRAVEPLVAALRDSRPSTLERARIALLLGQTGAPRAAPILADLLTAQDGELRIAAIDALGTLGAPTADRSLVEMLTSQDARYRLHAAIALSKAGGARARDSLLACLEQSYEIDRAAVFTALAGIMARVPSVDSVTKLRAELMLAAGPERDAILEAIGRAPIPAASSALAEAARSEEPGDRRSAATLYAAHPGDVVALEAVRGLLRDSDPTVRADAAWSLGTMGDDSDIKSLEALIRDPTTDPAANAAAAIGRIAARARAIEAAKLALCHRITDLRPSVRANALAGLSIAGARCEDGAPERRELAHPPAPPLGKNAVLVYVVPLGSATPKAGSSYRLELADGTIRSGVTDRRGALFDPAAPEGLMTLMTQSPEGR